MLNGDIVKIPERIETRGTWFLHYCDQIRKAKAYPMPREARHRRLFLLSTGLTIMCTGLAAFTGQLLLLVIFSAWGIGVPIGYLIKYPIAYREENRYKRYREILNDTRTPGIAFAKKEIKRLHNALQKARDLQEKLYSLRAQVKVDHLIDQLFIPLGRLQNARRILFFYVRSFGSGLPSFRSKYDIDTPLGNFEGNEYKRKQELFKVRDEIKSALQELAEIETKLKTELSKLQGGHLSVTILSDETGSLAVAKSSEEGALSITTPKQTT